MARVFVAASSQKLEHAGAPVTAVPLTMACWFRTTTTSWKTLVEIANSAGGVTGEFWLGLSSSGAGIGANRVGALVNGSNGAGSTVSHSTSDVWQHAAAVFTSDSSRAAFLNGGSKGTSAVSATPSGLNTTRVGVDAFGQYHDGAIAFPAIWNEALSDEEIAALGKGVHPRLIRPHALVASWPLWGYDAPEPDEWRSRYDLTLVNSPTKGDAPPILLPWQAPFIVDASGVAPAATGNMFLVF